MKRIHLALVVAVVSLGAFAAIANAGPVGTLEANLGYVKSSNNASPTNGDPLGGGVAFGAAYWRSASPMVSWGAEMSYDNLGSVNYDNGTTTDNTISSHVFQIAPAMRVNFGSVVGPNFFAQGGAGYYSVSSKVDDSVLGSATDSQGKFGFNIGAGVGFPVGPSTRMNILGQYNSVSTSGETLHYLGFRAGVGFGI